MRGTGCGEGCVGSNWTTPDSVAFHVTRAGEPGIQVKGSEPEGALLGVGRGRGWPAIVPEKRTAKNFCEVVDSLIP